MHIHADIADQPDSQPLLPDTKPKKDENKGSHMHVHSFYHADANVDANKNQSKRGLTKHLTGGVALAWTDDEDEPSVPRISVFESFFDDCSSNEE